MNRPCRAAALAALSLLAVAGCRRPTAESAGEPLPDFRLAALDGRRLGPAELRGKVVLYDFWATWCGPCHIQAATLHELYAGMRGREVEFVAISVGEPEQVVREFVAAHPYPYPVLVDPEDSLSPRLGILGLPTLVVVDRRGGVVFRNTGLVDRRTIEQALARAGA